MKCVYYKLYWRRFFLIWLFFFHSFLFFITNRWVFIRCQGGLQYFTNFHLSTLKVSILQLFCILNLMDILTSYLYWLFLFIIQFFSWRRDRHAFLLFPNKGNYMITFLHHNLFRRGNSGFPSIDLCLLPKNLKKFQLWPYLLILHILGLILFPWYSCHSSYFRYRDSLFLHFLENYSLIYVLFLEIVFLFLAVGPLLFSTLASIWTLLILILKGEPIFSFPFESYSSSSKIEWNSRFPMKSYVYRFPTLTSSKIFCLIHSLLYFMIGALIGPKFFLSYSNQLISQIGFSLTGLYSWVCSTSPSSSIWLGMTWMLYNLISWVGKINKFFL